MSMHTPRGTFYTTDDLIRMARLSQFGPYSKVLERALIKLRQTEIENDQLKQAIQKLVDSMEEPVEHQDTGEVNPEISEDQQEFYTNEMETTESEDSHLINPDIDY